jgi:hypothetical protein
VRRLCVFAGILVALGVVLYTAAAPTARKVAEPVWPPEPPVKGAPVSLDRPHLVAAGSFGDELAISPDLNQWASAGGLNLRYFWLHCDLEGAHCHPIRGLAGRRVIPPQGRGIFTIRGAVTATNARGSTTVASSNFRWDHAGIPLRFRGSPQYDPAQLRAWYALRPEQNGAGQTIVIVDPRRTLDLRAKVAHFSTHYRLPVPCGPHRGRKNCFDFRVRQPGATLPSLERGDESELDTEWAHAVAPRAKVVAVEGDNVLGVLEAIRSLPLSEAHVVSSSFCDPCRGESFFADETYSAVASTCDRLHVVCAFASGDADSPGDGPSNSPYVLAVGGSEFTWRRDGSIRGEARWPFGGFGVTKMPLARPTWQRDVPCTRAARSCSYRAVPDVSATAAGTPVFTPHERFSWFVLHGTSVSTPLWAALIALADQELASDGQPPIGIDELHQVLYRSDLSAGLDDLGHRGWNKRTGWGSPKAGIVDVLTQAIERYRSER